MSMTGNGMHVTNVMLMTLDGQISESTSQSDHDRQETSFYNPDDRELLLSEIAAADAVVVGARSARLPGGVIALDGKKQPFWCIVTRNGFRGDESFLSDESVPKIIYSKSDCSHLATKSNVLLGPRLGDDEASPSVVMEDLRRRGLCRVVLLGGGSMNNSFYRAKLVDRLKVTVAPLILASSGGSRFVDGALPEAVSLSLESSLVVGNHIFLEYIVAG